MTYMRKQTIKSTGFENKLSASVLRQMVPWKIAYESGSKKKKPSQALQLFATAILCSELKKGRLMLVVPGDHDERYLLGALMYMLDGTKKRTICGQKYGGFTNRS